jgi:hypothetical protein
MSVPLSQNWPKHLNVDDYCDDRRTYRTDDVQLAEQQSLSQEVIEDTGNIRAIRIRKSKKDRQHNG